MRAPGSLTSGEMEAVREVGPIAPATYLGLSGVRAVDVVGGATGQPCGLAVELAGQVGHAVVGQRDGVRVEGVGLEDVGAGLEVLPVDRLDDPGRRDGEQVVVALEVLRPVGEPLAAVGRLRGAVALDRGAHRAVDDQDPLRQQAGQLAGQVGPEVGGGLGHLAPSGRRAGRLEVGTGVRRVDTAPAS